MGIQWAELDATHAIVYERKGFHESASRIHSIEMAIRYQISMCDADVAPNGCHPEIYTECVNCGMEFCGICLRFIERDDLTCPRCGHNIWSGE